MQVQDQEIGQQPGSAFVNRLRELSELRAGIREALSGRGRLFTIAGEAGIGKSRLADEAANYGCAEGAQVLWGRCWEGGGAPAYWPWIQVVRGLTNLSDQSSVAKWMGAGAAEIAQIVPEVREIFPDLPDLPSAALAQPEQTRFRLFDSAVTFLRRAAQERPLMVILDDLHAADPTSLLMLVALSKEIRGAHLAVIGTYRESEMRGSPERAELIAAVEREGTRVALRGLGTLEIAQFVELVTGISPASSLISLLSKTTEGNPFFLSEILRLMAAEGQLAADASVTPRQLRVPDGVRESIKRRTSPLGEGARQALVTAAVIGREFDLPCLERASQIPRDDLIELLDEAVALELISEVEAPPGRYSFRHALIREALYETLPGARRRKLHRVVGNAIRNTYPPELHCAELAYHFCEAAPLGDAEEAVRYCRQAAELAERQLAYEEASRHLSIALEVLPLTHDANTLLRAELLFELGQAQTRAGDLAEARKTCLQAAELARQLKQIDLFARAVVAAGRAVSDSGTTDGSLVALLTGALERLGDADSAVRAQVLARLGVELYWSERERGVALCEQAVKIARRADDPHTLIIALWARHLSLRNPDRVEQRLADTREVIRIAEQAGEKDFALEARYYRIADLFEIGDIAAADVEQREYLKAEAELRDRFKRGLLLEGMRALLDGGYAEAESLAQQAFAAGQQSRRPVTLNSFMIQMGTILWERGRLGEFEPSLRAYIAQNPLIIFARCALVGSLIQGGRETDARIELDSLAKDDFSAVPRDWNWLPAMFVLADICSDLEAADYAATAYNLLTPYSSRNAVLGFVYCYGSISHALGRLAATIGRLDDAARHLEAALAANRRIRAATWIAHTQCEYGAVLLRRARPGDRSKALEYLASANRAALALGIGRLQRRLEQLFAVNGLTEAGLTTTKGAKTAGENKLAPEPDENRQVRLATAVAGVSDPNSIDVLAESAISETRNLSAFGAFAGTVTILFSDMEDSSAMFEKLGDLRAQEVLRVHHETIREQVSLHKGVEIKSMGDGFMIAFPSARRALLCAVDIQRALSAYSEQHPDHPIRVRIGLHAGEPISEAADFFGKAVIQAARLAGLAQGGEILVSSTLRDITESAGDFHFAEGMQVTLKGLSGEHRVYPVIWRSRNE